MTPSDHGGIAWPFGTLAPLTYDLIMADPPWRFLNYSSAGERKNASAKYRCMSLADIKALPVAHLARGDALLWLWATHPMLPQAIEVMAAWRFRYVTSGVWVKTTSSGKLSFGPGYVLRTASEPYLIGAFGRPRTARNIRTAFLAEAREHSRKPDLAYSIAEQWAIDATRRADLFSRETRPGWDGWGDESTKFDELTGAA